MTKRVLAVGGSEDFPGAVFLAAISALRSGAESVMIMAPEKVAWTINCLSPDLMTKKLKGKYLSQVHEKVIKKQLEKADILLLGNGAGVRQGTAALMRSLMRWPGQKVIDADGVKALKNNAVSNAIITPNEKEWKMLNERNDVKKLLHKNTIIIRKGFPTSIISNSGTYRMPGTNRGLQKAGTGDVLAGLCAGYLAQGFSLRDAAKKATETGNKIADMLTRKKRGYYFLASDIAMEVRKVRKNFDR